MVLSPEIVGMITGVLALVASVGFWMLDRRRARQDEVANLDKRLVKVETQIELLLRDVSFAAVQAATQLLHSPENELGLDEYIDRFNAGTLRREDAQEFIVLLKRVRESEPSPVKRHAADVLLREVERRRD